MGISLSAADSVQVLVLLKCASMLPVSFQRAGVLCFVTEDGSLAGQEPCVGCLAGLAGPGGPMLVIVIVLALPLLIV